MLTKMIMKSQRVIAVDKSVLAANMYQLLMRPLGVSVVNASSIAELREALRRFKGADLIVISSNVMADRLERAEEFFSKNELISKAAKVFLLREGEASEGWDKRLAGIPRMEVMTKPFHPEHFILWVKRILAIEE